MRKRLLPILVMQIMLISAVSGSAKQKVLVIVNDFFYAYNSQHVNRYYSDIWAIEHKNVELITWPASPSGTNVDQCTPLLRRLQQEYVEARNNGDVLEGAVFIGDVPVPQYEGEYGYMPLDQVYMDIVDRTTGNPYYLNPPYYTPFGITGDYYSSAANNGYSSGDGYYDIWVSRINAAYLWPDLREGMNNYDEWGVYVKYLNRVKDRMNGPATVPCRGFYMGGPEDLSPWGTPFELLGVYMNELRLPWLAEFTGHNSSFNWMSQLLAGPRGCINYGAFNGSLFPKTGRNKRVCQYNQLPAVYENGYGPPTVKTVGDNDSLGWEWAGLYNHSAPMHSNFFSNEANNIKLNGEFKFGTIGPLWGSGYRITTAGYGGSYYYYQDFPADPNPYQYGFGWKNKGAEWRWIVPAGGSGDYNVYLYYEAPNNPGKNPANCDAVGVSLRVVRRDAAGIPDKVEDYDFNVTVDQQTHKQTPGDPALPDGNYKWERMFGTAINIPENRMVIVGLQLNHDRPGDRIVDAVRFIKTGGGVDQIVDDAQPGNYPEAANNPGTIFSTAGFRSTDDVFRGFEDMGSEPGGGGFSKTQFFLMKACYSGDFLFTGVSTLDKNIGNLFALGYNGLTCMAPSEGDGVSDNKGPFTRSLRDGNCFGLAYLAKINSTFYDRHTLLGAGTLRSQPYIQYGSTVLENIIVSGSRTDNSNNPVLIRNATVNGSWEVTSTHNGLSPVGSRSEIVIKPETSFSPSGSNVVHLLAN
jgi:hypothetical protein